MNNIYKQLMNYQLMINKKEYYKINLCLLI